MKPESCIGCPYYDLPGPVHGVGPETAQLMMIGQNPWKDEIETITKENPNGIPFAGASGRVLNRGCYKAGVNRERAFVTNVVRCAVPPGQQLHPLAIKKCAHFLEEEVKRLPLLGAVLTIGQPAFDSLVPGKKLGIMHTPKMKQERNSWLRGCPIVATVAGRSLPIIPTLHPSYLIRTGFRETILMESDIKKAYEISQSPFEELYYELNYNPTEQDIHDIIQEILQQGYGVLDIETPEKALEEEEVVLRKTSTPIDVVGIAAKVGYAVGVPRDKIPLLSPLFQPREHLVDLFAFNAGFDGSHLATHGLSEGVRWVDPMLGFNIWFSDARPKDLAMLMSVFTKFPYTKNLSRTDPDKYNAFDLFGALEGGMNCIKELVRLGADKVFWEKDLPLIPIVEDLRRIGVRCDVAKAEKFELQCLMLLAKYEKWWEKNVPFVSWTSPKQLLPLFQKLGMPMRMKERVDKNTKMRKKTPCLDADVLEEYRDKYHSKTAGAILYMRELKHAGDFCNIFDSDGRSRSQYKIHGQKQGRLQSKEPDLQNIPERIAGITPRSIIIPDDPSHILFNADFDQIETWVYAWCAGDQPLLEFKKTGDYLYGLYWDEWKISSKPFFQEGKPRRKEFINPEINPTDILLIKSGPLGLQYGRGENSLMRFGVSKEKARGWREKYFRDHRAIELHHSKRLQDAERDGFLQNPFGRIRRFPNAHIMRNEILSFDGQCTGSDILKGNALIPFKRSLPDFHARVVLTVHDQVLISGPAKWESEISKHIKETMEAPIPEMDGFFIPISLKVGEDWGGVMRLEKWQLVKDGRTKSLVS